LGASTSAMPPPSEPRERPTTMPPPPRPGSGTPSSLGSASGKMLPSLPSAHANVTVRAPKPLPSVLSQSRIGRPSSTGGRKSAGDTEGGGILRPRSGSTVM
jgi:nuclear distribution protein NudE